MVIFWHFLVAITCDIFCIFVPETIPMNDEKDYSISFFISMYGGVLQTRHSEEHTQGLAVAARQDTIGPNGVQNV